MSTKQAIETSQEAKTDEDRACPVEYRICPNCYGTGTIFVGRALRVGNSRVCPVCRGRTKVPLKASV